MEFRWVYMTAASREDALRLARDLVERRLAACANVLGPMTSVYRWKGETCEDEEVALVAKTRAELLDRLTARVAAVHGYECPCVVALPIAGGHAPFLTWLVDETAPRPDAEGGGDG